VEAFDIAECAGVAAQNFSVEPAAAVGSRKAAPLADGAASRNSALEPSPWRRTPSSEVVPWRRTSYLPEMARSSAEEGATSKASLKESVPSPIFEHEQLGETSSVVEKLAEDVEPRSVEDLDIAAVALVAVGESR
jgi:hypothetical protein